MPRAEFLLIFRARRTPCARNSSLCSLRSAATETELDRRTPNVRLINFKPRRIVSHVGNRLTTAANLAGNGRNSVLSPAGSHAQVR